MKQLPIKSPAAVVDYGVRWARYLAEGDSLATSTWSIAGTATLSAPAIAGTDTRVWLTGGTAGETLVLTNRITTALGRTDERSFSVPVRPR